MRDFKYLHLISDDHTAQATGEQPIGNLTLIAIDSLRKVKSPCLIPCANAFAGNITRTLAFAMLPVETAFHSSLKLVCQIKAHGRGVGQSAPASLVEVVECDKNARILSALFCPDEEFREPKH